MKILEQGKEDNLYYVVLDNGTKLYSNNNKLKEHVYVRYDCCDYEVNKQPTKYLAKYRRHQDKLFNLKVEQITRDKLMSVIPPKKGDTILELGAYIGFGAVKLSQIVGETGRVVSVEADSSNFQVVKKNLVTNNCTNVIPINACIWSEETELDFYSVSTQGKSLVKGLLRKPTISKIQTITVDKLLEQMDIEVNLVTLEINLAEIEALRGMTNLLNNTKMRVIGAGWYNYKHKLAWKGMKEILENHGFKVYVGIKNRVYAIKGYDNDLA